MKKFIYLSITAVAALMALSCNKNDSIPQTPTGIPVYIDLDEIVIGDEDNADAVSKVMFNSTEVSNNKTRYNYEWEAGDKFKIFSFKYDEDKLLDWGFFTAKSGGKWGRFYGFIPYGFNPDEYTCTMAIHCPNMSDYTLNKTTTAGKYEIKFNIPAEQDGTGIKYAILAPNSNPQYSSFKVTRNVDSVDPDDVSKWTYAFDGQRLFKSYLAVSRLVVPENANVKTIRVTVSHAKSTNYALASNGANLDCSFNCLPSSFGGISGGTSKTITINKDNETLTEVYFTSRQTNGSNSNGYASLTFEFINGDGQIATKKVILATGVKEDGTAASYVNLSTYNVMHDFGTVTFAEGDFKTVE